MTLLSAALVRGAIGEYHLQAAIAAVHDEATRPAMVKAAIALYREAAAKTTSLPERTYLSAKAARAVLR